MRLHSWLSSKCRTAESPLAGIGVFATEAIRTGETIAVWGGVIYTAVEIESLGQIFPHFRTHPMEVAEGFFIGSTSLTAIDDAERFNHSCSPNIGVKGQILVIARRDIREGEELVFDYETTDIAPTAFQCRCGASECRGLIDGTAWRRSDFQQRHEGWITWFIADRIRQQQGVGP